MAIHVNMDRDVENVRIVVESLLTAVAWYKSVISKVTQSLRED